MTADTGRQSRDCSAPRRDVSESEIA